jgi:hypothetical protein
VDNQAQRALASTGSGHDRGGDPHRRPRLAPRDHRELHRDNGFAEVRGGLDGRSAGLEQITGMLTTLLDQRGDAR